MENQNKQIIVVDDSAANLTACKKSLKDLYNVYTAPSAEKMFEILEHILPDMILLDVEMPGTNGYDAMRTLRQNEKFKSIPVIFLSAMDDAQSEIEGLNLGAVDYIHKPFVSELLVRRIEAHMSVAEGHKKLESLNKSIEKLLLKNADGADFDMEAEKEAVRELIEKSAVLSQMGHEIRAPLNTIIKMVETAINSEDMATIKHCLGTADVETRLILEIIDEILDVSVGE
jgi:DNA-binding response OmpR family regulator